MRVGLFCYGEGGGGIDVDYFCYWYVDLFVVLVVDCEVEVVVGVKGFWCELVGMWDGWMVLLYYSFVDDCDGLGDL